MPNTLTINVDNPTQLLNAGAYGAGALVRVQSSATEGGVYADISGTGSTPTVAIVAGTTQYTAYDPTGTSTTWYRTRYENVGATRVSDWTDSFQVGELTAYATLDDLLERLELPDTSRYNLLSDLLVAASAYLDSRIGFDFYRHPQVSGTETRYFDVPRAGGKLKVPGGIVSATGISIGSTGASLTPIGAEGTDWYLYPRNLTEGNTYTHVSLLTYGSYGTFYNGQGVVSITGVFGWETPPVIIKEATLAHAARSFHEWRTKQAGIVGNPEFGTTNLTPNAPEIVYRAIETYRRYFWAGV